MANTKKYVSLDKLSLYDEKIKKFLADADGVALQSAKDYADSLESNYDAAGSANTALTDAKAYTDTEIGKVNTTVAGVKTTAEQGVTDAATAQAAADAAQLAADKAQDKADALETYVGTFTHDTAKNVVEYINAKTDGIATSGNLEALAGRVTAVEGEIDAIQADYLVEADKTELSGLITAAQEAAGKAQGEVDALEQTHATDKAALEAKDTELAEAIAAEQERATGVEDGLKGRIETMEAFWEAAQADGTDSNVIDTLKEIQDYIASDESGASAMAASIKKNADDIAAMDAAYKDADTALQDGINALGTAVDSKAAASDVEALTGRVDTAEDDIDALEGRMDTAEADIDALQALFGEGDGSVADQIADAVAAEAELRAQGDADVTAAAAEDATTKANTAETNAKTYADGLNTAMDARMVVVEGKAHEHANKAELDLIATGDKAKWDAAAAKAHEHANKTVLDGITAENITTWNTVTSKAAQTDLTAVGDRVTAIETWHANFVEVSEQEINDLFA